MAMPVPAPLTAPRYTLDDLARLPDDGNRDELLGGMLLVTPAPSVGHRRRSTRLTAQLYAAVEALGHRYVVGLGVVVRPPLNELQPDILVWPARLGSATSWADIGEHWLAVEILSRFSRI